MCFLSRCRCFINSHSRGPVAVKALQCLPPPYPRSSFPLNILTSIQAYYGNRMPEYVKVNSNSNSNSNRLDGGEGGSVGSEAARGAAAFWGRGGHG